MATALAQAEVPDTDIEISDEWMATINRRSEEMKNGTAKTYTREEVDAKIRKAIGL